MNMLQSLPIIAAVVSALIAGYLAIVKSKREMIWNERYKAIKDVLEANKIAYEYFTERGLHQAGVSSQLKAESDKLASILGDEIIKLRSGSIKMHLFFDGIIATYLGHRIWLVESALFEYLNMEPYEDIDDYVYEISRLARENMAIFSLLQKLTSVNIRPIWLTREYWAINQLARRYVYADERFSLPKIA